MEGNYGEIISYIEPKFKNGTELSLNDLSLLCFAYQKLKKYNKISPCMDKLLQKIDKEGTNFFTSSLLGSIYLAHAETEMELGNYDKAIESSKLAIKGWEETAVYKTTRITSFGTANVAMLMPAYSIWGVSLALKGDKAEALKVAETMSSLTWDGSHSEAGATAAIYMALGDYQKAIENFSSYLDFRMSFIKMGSFEDGVMDAYEFPYKFMKNKALLETQQYNEAKAGYDELLSLPNIQDNGGKYWQLLADRGRIALHEKQNDQAVELLKKSIDVIEQQRSSINTDVSKMGFVGDKQEVYKNLVSTLVQQKKFGEAFSYAERAKARALVDMLASKKQFKGGDAGAKTASLLSDLERSEADSIIIDARLTSDDMSKTRGIVVRKKQELMEAAPEMASLVSVSAPNVKELQKLLPDNEMLVEYYGVGEDLYVFLLNENGVSGGKLKGEGLNEQVMKYRKALTQSDSDQHRALGEGLYRRLIHPLSRAITNQNVTIVPHGILHYLPFNALFTGDEYVVDKYNIRLLPSASVMKFLKKDQKGQKGTLLALGNPDLGDPQYDLPGAQTEAVAISKQISGAKVLVRGQATESAVKQNGAGFRYLHLASHGTFDPEKPLSSALLLSKDSANDGALTVGELYDLKLNADLVTLSACETALGKIANGDDVVGFTRGFLYAGASSIVSSLWKVDDNATSMLMQEFYSKLQSTNKRHALRAAQLKVKAGKYFHPKYWAAFQLTGSVN